VLPLHHAVNARTKHLRQNLVFASGKVASQPEPTIPDADWPLSLPEPMVFCLDKQLLGICKGVRRFRSGTNPDSVAIAPSAQFAYVANGNDNTVSAYMIDCEGYLSPISGSPFPTGGLPFAIAITK
jgi:hypothetical protein